MKDVKIWAMLIAMAMTMTVLVSCGDEDNPALDEGVKVEDETTPPYKERTCIKNKTSYNWHDAGVQFMDVNGRKVKYVEIGTVAINDYRYVPIEAEYFVVDFKDDNGDRHTSERYYSNPYIDISFLVD